MKIIVKNDQLALDIIFEGISNFCLIYELPDCIEHNLKVIVDEIVSNIINYSTSAENSDKIYLSISKKNNDVKLKITDFGERFNPLLRADPDISSDIDDRAIGGLGIYLVRQFSKEVRYQRKDDKNILTVILSVK